MIATFQLREETEFADKYLSLISLILCSNVVILNTIKEANAKVTC
jgi:hypothetical protein